MPWLGIEDGQQTSLKFNNNDRVEVVNADLSEKRTSPPDYLTESELITLMEKHGIGKFFNATNLKFFMNYFYSTFLYAFVIYLAFVYSFC